MNNFIGMAMKQHQLILNCTFFTKLLITWSQTGVAVKDTSLVIKPFRGNAKTTSNDLITYYTSACLAKFPDFISNAEVLGINVVDQVRLSLLLCGPFPQFVLFRSLFHDCRLSTQLALGLCFHFLVLVEVSQH